MRMNSTSSSKIGVWIACIFLICLSFPSFGQLFGSLKGRIEKELAENPFLKKEGIRLKVASEENGYVTLQMISGDKRVRQEIADGGDPMAATFGVSFLSDPAASEKRALAVLRRTVLQVQGMEGVKQVLVTAVLKTAYEKGQEAYSKKDHKEAFRYFTEAAQEGNAEAEFNLGVMYDLGQGVGQDYGKAAEWYRKAAEQGNPQAQINLGAAYYSGEGVGQDHAKAVECYRKAAEQGNAGAQYTLGRMYHLGQGVGQDYGKSVEWYRKAAEQGNADAQYNLGLMYKKGQGVPQDYGKALEWYRKAAELGNAGAQRSLGFMYEKGQGVPQDSGKALECFRKAAEQGVVDGDNYLAWFYATCRDARFRDGKKALECALKATDRSDNKFFCFSSLAAAYAANGQFAKAVQTQEEAITMLKQAGITSELNDYEKRLELYKKNTAYVDDESSTTP